MYTVVIAAAFLAVVMVVLWLLLSNWANNRIDPEVQRLRLRASDLIAVNALLPAAEVRREFDQLIDQGGIVVTFAEAQDVVPLLFSGLDPMTREILVRYKVISVPESSIEVGWSHLGLQPDGRLRIGRAFETNCEVLLDIESGRVDIGKDAFSGVVHLLVFFASE